jgi:hypothetical protein
MQLYGHITTESPQFRDALAADCVIGVWLDGEKLERVAECHTEEGWAVVFVLDDSGNSVWDGENALTRKLEGAVVAKRVKR